LPCNAALDRQTDGQTDARATDDGRHQVRHAGQAPASQPPADVVCQLTTSCLVNELATSCPTMTGRSLHAAQRPLVVRPVNATRSSYLRYVTIHTQTPLTYLLTDSSHHTEPCSLYASGLQCFTDTRASSLHSSRMQYLVTRRRYMFTIENTSEIGVCF